MCNALIEILAQSYGAKTLFTEYLAVCIINGVKFLGFKTVKAPVLIIDQDTPTDRLYSQIRRFNNKFKDNVDRMPLYIESMHGYSLAPINQYTSSLLEVIKKYLIGVNPRIKLVIIDSLHSMCENIDVNSTNDMNKLSFFKNQLLSEYKDLTVIINHHISEHKYRDFNNIMTEDAHGLAMGNSTIIQQADELIILKPKGFNNKKLSEVGVRPIAKRQAIPTDPFIIKLNDKNGIFEFVFKEFYTEPTPKIESHIITLFKSLNTKTKRMLTVREVYERMHDLHGICSIRKALNRMTNEKILSLKIHKPYPFEYSLRKNPKKLSRVYHDRCDDLNIQKSQKKHGKTICSGLHSKREKTITTHDSHNGVFMRGKTYRGKKHV